MLKDTLYATAKDTLGIQNRRHRDWPSENDKAIQTLLEQKHATFRDPLKDNTPQTRNKCHELRHMKNHWWLDQAKENKDLAERHDSKGFLKTIKLIAQRKNFGFTPSTAAQDLE